MTGMREGELLGLRWQDLDWDAGRLQVRHTLQWPRRLPWRLDAPKSEHGRRSIKLAPTALTALRAHRARQNEARLAVGAVWDDLDFVFCTALGRPLDSAWLRSQPFPRLLARAGLPRIRFH